MYMEMESLVCHMKLFLWSTSYFFFVLGFEPRVLLGKCCTSEQHLPVLSFFFFSVLGFEFGASRWLGRRSTT
jgi:hypothetical protein